MVMRRNQSNNRREQAHSGQDPIQQIQNARAAILSFCGNELGMTALRRTSSSRVFSEP